MKVYLAGPINGCSDAEARGWRNDAKRLRPDIEWVDPMVRDYRGNEAQNADAIVSGDLSDIASCDVVLVNAERATWGTAMELRAAAAEYRKPAVAFCSANRPSPWLLVHARVVPTLAEALALL